MSRARRASPHGRGWGNGLLLTAGFAGIAAALVVVAAQLQPDDGPAVGGPTTSSAPTGASVAGVQSATPQSVQSATPQRDAANPAAAACSGEIAATEAVVTAARVAAGHWREHVQARTDLLTAKNTEAITKAIWKRTRLAGPADQARLDAATAGQKKVVGGCQGLTSAAAPACKQRLAALTAAAATGRAASGDWAAHLAMMKAHAAGDFGAEHAQHLWVAAWQNAPKNLDAFAQADAALAKAPTCRPS
ncbi:hypothetical protein EV643_111234 [Kribbella sp. VKM Ac-2527]|uniref:Uncharacterized protein n=1 Tax=Kribbella caucasensis TaxID=2512215 RepID=A0A4R6KB93_9ACTN|nr:hypothetical protein [Kribbella sp. VKM Ac-2527]TDO46381.1 hypothetical protein EV643_111234 [Kribbella sp. VKM Ac-2527]